MIDIDLYVAFFTGDSSPHEKKRLLKNASQTMEKARDARKEEEKRINWSMNKEDLFFPSVKQSYLYGQKCALAR
jgi:hypothetical protein